MAMNQHSASIYNIWASLMMLTSNMSRAVRMCKHSCEEGSRPSYLLRSEILPTIGTKIPKLVTSGSAPNKEKVITSRLPETCLRSATYTTSVTSLFVFHYIRFFELRPVKTARPITTIKMSNHAFSCKVYFWGHIPKTPFSGPEMGILSFDVETITFNSVWPIWVTRSSYNADRREVYSAYGDNIANSL
jgi:hypothetical protein